MEVLKVLAILKPMSLVRPFPQTFSVNVVR